jgi:hypothetical protein
MAKGYRGADWPPAKHWLNVCRGPLAAVFDGYGRVRGELRDAFDKAAAGNPRRRRSYSQGQGEAVGDLGAGVPRPQILAKMQADLSVRRNVRRDARTTIDASDARPRQVVAVCCRPPAREGDAGASAIRGSITE